MEVKLCKVCNKIEKTPKCGGRCKACYMEWDRQRKNKDYAERKPRIIKCVICNNEYRALDNRSATCSPKCKYALTAKTMQETLGYPNPSQKPRTEEERAQISRNKSAAMLSIPRERMEKSQVKRLATNREKYGNAVPNIQIAIFFNAPKVFCESTDIGEVLDAPSFWRKTDDRLRHNDQGTC